jgi:hypothetical protein
MGRNLIPGGTISLVIPFEAPAKAISEPSLEDKQWFWELLYEQIEQADEDLPEQDLTAIPFS